jgi:HEAT repeat protein
MAADLEAAKELQDLFAKTLKEALANDPGAATLNVIRQFLKDHNIPLRGSAEVGALENALAEYDESELPENVARINRDTM